MQVDSIPLHLLVPSKKNRALGDVSELRDSLAQLGQVHNIVVFRLPEEKYRIIAGHRRVAAARLLKWEAIGALVVDNEKKLDLIQAAENLVRADLALSEKAELAVELMKAHQLPDVARAFGVRADHVQKIARLKAELCDEAWTVLEGQGKQAKISEWLPFLTMSPEVQQKKLFALGAAEKKPRKMVRARQVDAKIEGLPPNDVRAHVLRWVLNLGPFPEGRYPASKERLDK